MLVVGRCLAPGRPVRTPTQPTVARVRACGGAGIGFAPVEASSEERPVLNASQTTTRPPSAAIAHGWRRWSVQRSSPPDGVAGSVDGDQLAWAFGSLSRLASGVGYSVVIERGCEHEG